MRKVTEIKVMGEGMQLRQIFDEKNYSCNALAKKFGIGRDSLLRYLFTIQINIPKFRGQIEEMFQIPFYQLIIPVKKQIEDYIIEIKDNIKYYNAPEDSKILNEIYDLTIKYSGLYEQLMARGNVALYQYNMGLIYDAIDMLEEVVKNCKENKFAELAVYYSVQLAFLYYSSDDLKKSKNTLNLVDEMIKEDTSKENVSKLTLFNYFYLNGIILKHLKKYKTSIENLERAEAWAEDDTKRARVFLNIGLAFYEQSKFRRALEWTRKAMDIGLQYPDIRGALLNNMANIHIKRGETWRAGQYILEAMKNIGDDFDINIKMCIYDTYLEVFDKYPDVIFQDVISLLEKCMVVTAQQYYLPSCVEKLYHLLTNDKEYDKLMNLLQKIFSYCDLEGEKRPLEELKIIGMDIFRYLIKEGVYNLEEGYKNVIDKPDIIESFQ